MLIIGNAKMTLVKFRESGHQLRIEAGWYKKLEDNGRICLLCDSGEIESEIHFLMDCSYFSDKGHYFSILDKKLFKLLKIVILKNSSKISFQQIIRLF